MFGKLPEWSIGADSKSVVLLCGTGGSNPSLSAENTLGMTSFPDPGSSGKDVIFS